jgi:Asp-tRNA(Asn)/Glu-tRNA(Gln) amidotransferase A subunit family amidase
MEEPSMTEHRRAAAAAAVSLAALVAAAPPASAQDFAIDEATIASVHAAFASGELTCRQLVEGYLARIEALDDQGPALNAILAVNPEALTLADEMDAAFAADPEGVGPMHCVPVILKDNYDTADMPTTAASSALEGAVPERDAFVVGKMREAGALILAKSNLTEFAMGGTTISSLGGQTLNAYDQTRTPGGSSGGTGAAIAANFGLVGTGSDTGQSTRSPASANNLVGFRTTRGLVSRGGITPLSVTQDEIGPITRTVEDNARMLDVWAGFDPDDPITAFGVGKTPESYLDSLNPDGMQGARIGVLRDFFGTEEVHAEVNAVADAALATMQELGATLVDVTIPDIGTLTSGMGTSAWETGPAMEAYLARFGDGTPHRTLADIGATGLVHPDIQPSFEGRGAAEDLLEEPDYTAIFLKRDRLRLALMTAMAENELDALFYPHQKRLVVPVGEEQVERNGVLSNATGFPAITFPGGFSAPSETAPLGVPVGIELLGPEFSEPRLFELAYAFEQATEHRKPPAFLDDVNY